MQVYILNIHIQICTCINLNIYDMNRDGDGITEKCLTKVGKRDIVGGG